MLKCLVSDVLLVVTVVSCTQFVPQVKCHPIIRSNIQCKDFGSGSEVKGNRLITGNGISEKSLFSQKSGRILKHNFVNVRAPNKFLTCDKNVLPLFGDKNQNQLHSLIQLPIKMHFKKPQTSDVAQNLVFLGKKCTFPFRVSGPQMLPVFTQRTHGRKDGRHRSAFPCLS